MVISSYYIGDYEWLLLDILLMAIGGYCIDGYYINGYWWLFYQ
jgi:hypothetical protein